MNIEQEIRAQIEKNKGLKLAVGEINSHLSVLEGLLRNERDDAQKRVDEAYQKGLDDAWECARELYLNGACKDLFGEYFSTFIKYHTAQEAIEKLKAYEAEQGHSDTIDESYTIGYKQANNNSKSNTECDGCLYDYGIKEHSLCHTCSNAYINHWTAKKQDDKIEVGDEVKHDRGWVAVVTQIDESGLSCVDKSGAVASYSDTSKFRKTGRHFDIEKILEEMRE